MNEVMENKERRRREERMTQHGTTAWDVALTVYMMHEHFFRIKRRG